MLREEKGLMTIKERKIGLSGIIFLIWSIFIVFVLWGLRQEAVQVFLRNKDYTRLVELTIILAIIGESMIFKAFWGKWSDKKKGMVLFLIALAVRLFFLQFAQYIPTSDFANYFKGAYRFAEGGFKAGVDEGLKAYSSIPTFGGQAIINGLFLRILSPTLIGMQILNSLYTSGICVLVFVLGKDINTKAAVIGAVLYTFYPTSILSTQITTNHHGATFFLLLGIYFFLLGIKKEKTEIRILFLGTSGVWLTVSNYYHPSVIIMLCAFIAYMVMYELSIFIKDPKVFFPSLRNEIVQVKGIFLSTVIVLVIYTIVSRGTLWMMQMGGYIEGKGSLPLAKFVVGLNWESEGSQNKEDHELLVAIPKEQINAECIKLVKERLSEHTLGEILEFFVRKTEHTWFIDDNYYSFYRVGKKNELEKKMEEATDPTIKAMYAEEKEAFRKFVAGDICYTDVAMVYLFWMLALIGILSIIIKYKDDCYMYLLMYLPLGWMLFIMLTERQPRYRYQSMPVIIMLAGFGLQVIREKAKAIYEKNKIQKQEKLQMKTL